MNIDDRGERAEISPEDVARLRGEIFRELESQVKAGGLQTREEREGAVWTLLAGVEPDALRDALLVELTLGELDRISRMGTQ